MEILFYFPWLAVNLFKISKSRHQKQITSIKTSPPFSVAKKCVRSLSSWPLYPSYYILRANKSEKKRKKKFRKEIREIDIKMVSAGRGSFTFVAIVTLYDFMPNIN